MSIIIAYALLYIIIASYIFVRLSYLLREDGEVPEFHEVFLVSVFWPISIVLTFIIWAVKIIRDSWIEFPVRGRATNSITKKIVRARSPCSSGCSTSFVRFQTEGGPSKIQFSSF